MVIYMDKESGEKLRQGAVWERKCHADLLNRLTNCRPKAVVFDLEFHEESSGTNDQTFATALRGAREAGIPVILGATLDRETKPLSSVWTKERAPISSFREVSEWGLAEAGREPLRCHLTVSDCV